MNADGVYAVALGGVLLLLAIVRSGWRQWRTWIGISLVILGSLLGYGGTGKAYPGGPAIGIDTQASMLLVGTVAALAGYGLLLWSALCPRGRRPRAKHP